METESNVRNIKIRQVKPSYGIEEQKGILEVI